MERRRGKKEVVQTPSLSLSLISTRGRPFAFSSLFSACIPEPRKVLLVSGSVAYPLTLSLSLTLLFHSSHPIANCSRDSLIILPIASHSFLDQTSVRSLLPSLPIPTRGTSLSNQDRELMYQCFHRFSHLPYFFILGSASCLSVGVTKLSCNDTREREATNGYVCVSECTDSHRVQGTFCLSDLSLCLRLSSSEFRKLSFPSQCTCVFHSLSS